ncbi:cytochrome P450 [Streptomyces sp. NPDC056697]|uniref:cytochrome P450 n=1 Tax=Streptomyces sp. NPDC056697 TaxID=3345915 RepID=UPI00369BA65E
MTLPPSVPSPGWAPSGACPYSAPSAAISSAEPVALFGPEYEANPRAVYERLRAMGPIAPVEIAPRVYGQITTTYAAALHLLRNTPEKFAKDPDHWAALRSGQVPADSPALPLLQRRPNALWMDGPAHARLRQSITDSLARVDTHDLAVTVTRIADALIDTFAPRGHADLVADYGGLLPTLVLIDMFGGSPEVSRRIVAALRKLFSVAHDAVQANRDLEAACLELVRIKRRQPGMDATSWLLDHPVGLTDDEMVQQMLLVFGAASQPSTNLITTALLLMLDDDRFAGNVYDGVLPVSAALDDVLWEETPVANYCPLYPRYPTTYENVPLQPGVPVLVSFAMANTDPRFTPYADRHAGNAAHLAFSAGVHGCAGPDLARIICETAVERVLDRLPDLALARPRHQLPRQQGWFLSGWASVPITFPPAPLVAAHTPLGAR